jgi:ketosteroid isomerase-like protein
VALTRVSELDLSRRHIRRPNLVILGDLNIKGVTVTPPETDPPLLVDPRILLFMWDNRKVAMDFAAAGECNGSVHRSEELKRKGVSMKHTRGVCLLGLLSLFGVALVQAQQAGGTEKTIMALENQWLKSQQTNNPDLTAPLLADKYVFTSEDGKVMNKAQSLADAKATKYTSAEYENVQVTVFRDTAIAIGGGKFKGTEASGKPMDSHERFTDTWVKMPDGKWQCVATHVSAIKM